MSDFENTAKELEKFAEEGNFASAARLLRDNAKSAIANLGPTGIKDALKKTTKDRLFVSFVDACDFAASPDKAFAKLEKLLSLQPGVKVVCSKSLEWGLGIVKRLDYFYRKITVDFKTKRSHQLTYDAACDLLDIAPEDHILAIQYADNVRFEAMMKERRTEFMVAVIKSFGTEGRYIGQQKLEDVCVKCGFVKSVNWKSFWTQTKDMIKLEASKGETKETIAIPSKKSEPLEIKVAKEDYGDNWLGALAGTNDPKQIFTMVREFKQSSKAKSEQGVAEREKELVAERLAFALKGAMLVDDALYARLALLATDWQIASPTAQEMRKYLWERKRYIKASANLPARELSRFIAFIADGEEARAKICASIGEFCYSAVQEIVSLFASFPESRKAIADWMRTAKAPATLTTLFAGSYQRFKDTWKELPPFITLLTQAIALGEGRQSGETLKMQNIIRRLFGDKKWLEKAFQELEPADKVVFFERFQASIAWEAASHHAIVVRMTHLVPELAGHVVRAEKKREYPRLTSPRSYAAKKKEYLKLINEDMPANVKRIEFAKGFGDLSENAEYQYAKDEQRALMFKQSEMQAELDAVKADMFLDATTDEVMPGVRVRVSTADGEKSFIILGEWDNDLEKGIISSKTRLAANMLGKKAGEEFELPGAQGEATSGKILAIEALSAEVREWMAQEG